MERNLIAKARAGRTKALETLAYRQLILSHIPIINQRVERTRQASLPPNALASIRNIFQQSPALHHGEFARADHSRIAAHN